MRLALFAAATAVIIAAPASAADMLVKAPLVPPVLPYNWSGFYAGGNVGYSWGSASNTWNYFAVGANAAATSGVCRPAGSALCAGGSDSSSLDGVIGGVQFGYNWQVTNYLIGLETDFEGSGQKGSDTLGAAFPLNGTPGGTIATSYSENLNWLGTVRLRAGYVVADRWLVFATGGLAYGRVSISGSANSVGTTIPGLSAAACTIGAGGVGICPVAGFSDGVTKVGWAAGAGVEGAIVGNWSWKVEYLHVDLGGVNLAFATLPGCYGVAGACGPVAAGIGTVSSRVTDEIARVGFNYRFAPL